jgi:type VI secretion system protein ImpA
MKRVIDTAAILAPIPGENPAGEALHYSPIYDELKEARRADEPLALGDWKREIKTSDWDKVITLAVDALTNKTKDLQLAVWLTEALIMTEGFEGLAAGLKIITGLLRDYWDHLHPVIEEGDVEFRTAPLEFMNDKLWPSVKQVPLTESGVTPGYSWLKWQESREVGYEADTRNKYGDVDENKKKRREELLAEGKLTAEEFDSAVALSSNAFYKSLAESLAACREEFKNLDEMADQKFGAEAPRLSEFGQAVEDCERVVMRIYKEQKGLALAPAPETPAEKAQPSSAEEKKEEKEGQHLEATASEYVSRVPSVQVTDTGASEKALWEEAVKIVETAGIRKALDRLLGVCYSAPSVREKNRCRLLIAKLCLKAERPDLARPIVEELHALIEELHLERWESPIWIAEVLEALYLCLTKGEPSDDASSRARTLFQRLCTTDVTKAILYRS